MARLDGSKDSYPRKRRKMTPEEHERRRRKKELQQAQQPPQQPKRIGRPPKRKVNDDSNRNNSISSAGARGSNSSNSKDNTKVSNFETVEHDDVDLTTILGQEDPNEAEHFHAAMKATDEANRHSNSHSNTPNKIQSQNSLQSTPSPLKTSPISTRSQCKNPDRPQINQNARGYGGKQIHLMKQQAAGKGTVTSPVTTINNSGSQGRALASSNARRINNNNNNNNNSNKAISVNSQKQASHGGDKHLEVENQRVNHEDKIKESRSASSQGPSTDTNNNNGQKQQNVQKAAAAYDSVSTAKDRHSAGVETIATEKKAGTGTGKNAVDGGTSASGKSTGEDAITKSKVGTTTTVTPGGAAAPKKSVKKPGGSTSSKTSQPGDPSSMSRHAYTCTNPQTGMIPPIVNTFQTPYGVWTNTITFTPHNVIYPGSFPSSTTNFAIPPTNMMAAAAPFNPYANMMASQAAANTFYSQAMVQGYYNGANVNGMFGMQQQPNYTTYQDQQPFDPFAVSARAMSDFWSGKRRGKDLRKRRPRSCARCKKFEGEHPNECVGRCAHLGENSCEYFNEDGTKRILLCKRCEQYSGGRASECIGRLESKGGEDSCEYFEQDGTKKLPCKRCEKYNGSYAYRCAGRTEGNDETSCEYFNEDGTTKINGDPPDEDVEIETSSCKRCQKYDGPHADECSGGAVVDDQEDVDETLCEYFNEDGTRRALKPSIVP